MNMVRVSRVASKLQLGDDEMPIQTYIHMECHAPLHEECPQHHGYKVDPRMMPEIWGTIGERAQMILVWVRAPCIESAFHPRTLGVMRIKP